MKKSILLAAIGLVASVSSTFGLGYILLDNYASSGPMVTYGPGGLNPVGTGLGAGWTAGFYYALGNVTGSIAADPSGYADPTTLGGGLVLGTGPGSTAAFGFPFAPGYFSAPQGFQIADNPGDTITVMVVAYDGASYATSLDRGHSVAFTMPLGAVTTPPPVNAVGFFMPGFSIITPVPEPATLALGGLGLASLLFFRRKQA